MPHHDPQHDHTLPRPLPQAGACTPAAWSSAPFRLNISQTPQTQRVRNWTHCPTNLLLLQGALLSKGTTVYQVMHTRNLRAPLVPPSSPSITFFFTSQISYRSTSHCHHPSPCPITSNPPASLLTCYPCSLATYQFLLYAMFLLAQGLCTC